MDKGCVLLSRQPNKWHPGAKQWPESLFLPWPHLPLCIHTYGMFCWLFFCASKPLQIRTGGEKWVHFGQKPTSVSVHWTIDSRLGTKGNDCFGLELFGYSWTKQKAPNNVGFFFFFFPFTELIEMVLWNGALNRLYEFRWSCQTRHTIYTFSQFVPSELKACCFVPLYTCTTIKPDLNWCFFFCGRTCFYTHKPWDYLLQPHHNSI